MMSPEIQVVEFTEIVGDLEIPCDFAALEEYNPHDDPAEWVMHRSPCCPAKRYPALACEGCKEARLMDQLSLECEHCGHIFEHSPDAYTLIEPLNKRGAK